MDFYRQTSCLAVPANLPQLLGFVEQACRDAGLDEATAFALRLAGEEACCNVLNHAYAGREPGPVSLELRTEGRRAVLVVEDRAPVFRPEDAPGPDLSTGWMERRLGGLGWHLIHEVMDEVRHEALRDGGNRLTMVKLANTEDPA